MISLERQLTRSQIEAERLLRGLLLLDSLSSLRLNKGEGEIGAIKDIIEVKEEIDVDLDPMPFSSIIVSSK